MQSKAKLVQATLRRSDFPSDYVLVPATDSKSELKDEPTVMSGLVSGMKTSKMLGGAYALPPTLGITPVARHTFRYTVSAGGSFSVTQAAVIGALGTVCTVTNSTVRPFASSFKINKITIWGSQPGGASSSSARLYWNAAVGVQSRDREFDRTFPEGMTAAPGALVMVPPRGTLGAMWQTSSSTAIFSVSLNSGTVLDLDISFTLSNQFLSGTQTVATGVLGNIYYLYLDGSTSHSLVPIALPSTF